MYRTCFTASPQSNLQSLISRCNVATMRDYEGSRGTGLPCEEPSTCAFLERTLAMVVITFPDSDTQKKAVGFLLGRFSGKVLKNGEHIVPEAALAALADRNISFTVHGKASYEKQIAALRSAASGAAQ